MLTRAAAKRSRGLKDEEDVQSVNTHRRRKRQIRRRTVWNNSLLFTGPKSLDQYNRERRLTRDDLDDFVEHALELVHPMSVDAKCVTITQPPFLPPLVANAQGQRRKTLVLDIDETLVHSVTDIDANEKYDVTFDVEFNGIVKTIGMKKRPYASEFLSWCGANFEVVTFTSGIKPYSDQVLNTLDPNGKHVSHRLHREHCTIGNHDNYLKNLDHLQRDLSQILIVDNSPISFAQHMDNGIPIQSFMGDETDKDDTEFIKLKNFLEELLVVDDVRKVIRERFKLHEFLAYLGSQADLIGT